VQKHVANTQLFATKPNILHILVDEPVFLQQELKKGGLFPWKTGQNSCTALKHVLLPSHHRSTMSKINIQGTIDNIKSKSNVYTPLIEAIVNSIDSISLGGVSAGKVDITLIREQVFSFDDSLPPVTSIEIHDNGIGFTQDNRDSFDTLYSLTKKDAGGKGFGRFMFLKYFGDVRIESIYKDKEGKLWMRKFRFGRKYDIIVDETNDLAEGLEQKTTVFLSNLYNDKHFDKEIETISRKILERLLIFFINENFTCPIITVREQDGSSQIVLNDYHRTADHEIQLVKTVPMEVKASNGLVENFTIKIFKIYFSKVDSKIILTAHNREVTETALHSFVPEFEEEFFDEFDKSGKIVQKNYIIKTYVLGHYLDSNVSLERENFNFDKEKPDSYFAFSQSDIERQAAEVTKKAFEDDVKIRAEKKQKRIFEYVAREAPWHKSYIQHVDITMFPSNATNERIEIELQRHKFQVEQQTRTDISFLLNNTADDEFPDRLSQIVSKITEIGKSDLAHYVCNRKAVLQVFEELRKRNEDGTASLEKEIHSLIYPMNRDSSNTSYEEHNLWLLDERLVFSEYIASDRKISTAVDALDEPDLVIFDIKNTYRSGENEFSNPLTIFEFKRPKRKTYSQDEDPILQIGNYLEKIRAGKYEMPMGLEPIKVNESTPVYAYVVCDIVDKIQEFARNNQLTITADKEGYFGYHAGFRMYVEIMSFKKIYTNANLRNKIFFKHLHLD
jgi:hypothetical protein